MLNYLNQAILGTPRYVNLGTLQENSFQVTLPSKGAPEAALEEELTSM